MLQRGPTQPDGHWQSPITGWQRPPFKHWHFCWHSKPWKPSGQAVEDTYIHLNVNWTSFSDIIPLLLSYVFHSTFQSSLVNKYRHRSHARTLLHSHTGICDGSPGRRNPQDTLENAMKTSENARFVFAGNANGCSYFDHSVVPCSLLHSGTAQSQGHSCPRCSCSHTGWRSSAPSVPPHKLPQSIHASLHQIINSHSTTEITLWVK